MSANISKMLVRNAKRIAAERRKTIVNKKDGNSTIQIQKRRNRMKRKNMSKQKYPNRNTKYFYTRGQGITTWKESKYNGN